MLQPSHFLDFVPFQYPQSSTKPQFINCIHIYIYSYVSISPYCPFIVDGYVKPIIINQKGF